MSKYKVISHVERMKNKKAFDKHVDTDITYGECSHLVSEQVLDKDTGYIMKQMKLETYDPADNVKGFKYTDFSIENLVATGAISDLKVVSSPGSKIGSIDNMVSVLSSMDIEEK